MATHREITRREFAHQAASFEGPRSFFGDGEVLAWIDSHVAVRAGDRLLDVAGGTGQLGRHLGRRARSTTIVDLTPEMLRTGAEAAAAAGRDDVLYVRGDATDLPFPADQFDVVVCRFALHHIDEPGAAIAEMARVSRPGGIVACMDMLSPPEREGDRHNELERLRDPSHATALRAEELRDLYAEAGLEVVDEDRRDQVLEADPWLERAASPAAKPRTVRAALLAEAQGGPATGLRAALDGETLTITMLWTVLVGRARS